MVGKQACPDGIDCTRLGVDQSGAIAAFVTAGDGEIPHALLGEAAVDVQNLDALLMSLPVIGDVTLHVRVPRPDSFLDMASRGLYVYDWSGGQYALVAEPGNAVNYAGLNNDLQWLADFAVFDSFQLSRESVISFESMAEFIRPGR